jgi:hypothetical protein
VLSLVPVLLVFRGPGDIVMSLVEDTCSHSRGTSSLRSQHVGSLEREVPGTAVSSKSRLALQLVLHPAAWTRSTMILSGQSYDLLGQLGSKSSTLTVHVGWSP